MCSINTKQTYFTWKADFQCIWKNYLLYNNINFTWDCLNVVLPITLRCNTVVQRELWDWWERWDPLKYRFFNKASKPSHKYTFGRFPLGKLHNLGCCHLGKYLQECLKKHDSWWIHSKLFTNWHVSWDTPVGTFPNGNFPNVQFPKRQLPK